MIQKSVRNLLLNNVKKTALVRTQARTMGGGERKPNMSPDERNFDVVLVGGFNATALTKFLQYDAPNPDLKMALISKDGKFIVPQAYFACSHAHQPDLKLLSQSVSAQVESWSRTDVGATVAKYMPEENKVLLSNGREYSYKALVLAPGFDHQESHIEGLAEMTSNNDGNKIGVFSHMLDTKDRVLNKNYYHGCNHTHGDMICYDPKFPFKGEGSSFYALYYEAMSRDAKTVGNCALGARVQYWTPNKEIFQFPYANEVALEECHKRGVDVMFGWEMVKVHFDEKGQKIATFKNVDSGEMLEHPFSMANINPPSKTHQELIDGGVTGSDGLIDVNPYTLQHERFDNIFAFGDAIRGNTTRTQTAASAQCPVVKHNVKNFLAGQELNGVYDGYSYMPFYLSQGTATCFQHFYDFEPAPMNHWVPSYGLFSNFYFSRQIASNLGDGLKYAGMKKNHGPPHYNYNASYDPLESNEYLAAKGIDLESLRGAKSVVPA